MAENEVSKVNTETGEIIEVNNERVILDTPEYDVTVDENGKKVKHAKYLDYSSVDIEKLDHKQKIKFFNVINGSDKTVKSLKSDVPVGTEITVKQVVFRPYEKINDNDFKRSVNTIIFDEDGQAYATSSAKVYFDLLNAFKVFGFPNDEKYEPLKFKIDRTKSNFSNRDMLCLILVG